jgi:hypothetical protein
MGYNQWVSFVISNRTNNTITIKNADLQYGKWYRDGNKDFHIELEDINRIVINPGERIRINCCGRFVTITGCEGSFDLVEEDGTAIRHIYFNCPFFNKTNTLTIAIERKTNYIVEQQGANFDGGALGNVEITLTPHTQDSSNGLKRINSKKMLNLTKMLNQL